MANQSIVAVSRVFLAKKIENLIDFRNLLILKEVIIGIRVPN